MADGKKTSALRQRIRADYHETILAAALEEFTEHGYQKAQIRDIATRAEVAVGTIYNLFGNKEALYVALIRAQAMEIAARASEYLLHAEDPLDAIIGFITLKDELLRDHGPALKLYMGGLSPGHLSHGLTLPDELKQGYMKLLELGASIFKQAIDAGLIVDSHEPFELVVALDHMTNGFVALELEDPQRFPYRARIDGLVSLSLGSILTDAGRIKLGDAYAF